MVSLGISRVYSPIPVNAALCSSIAATCWSRRQAASPSTTPIGPHTLTWAMLLGNRSEYLPIYILCGYMKDYNVSQTGKKIRTLEYGAQTTAEWHSLKDEFITQISWDSNYKWKQKQVSKRPFVACSTEIWGVEFNYSMESGVNLSNPAILSLWWKDLQSLRAVNLSSKVHVYFNSYGLNCDQQSHVSGTTC